MMKVLLVDDEPWILEGLRTMIEWGKYGFEVCGEALNGPDALELILELKPELVLTDINMPVINGLELIAQLNERMAKPPKFVILSGYDDFKYARAALRQRVNEYLLKPIDDDEIEALLGRVSALIQEELSAEQTFSRKQSLIFNNIMNRLIQGEYTEDLELQARSLMSLQEDGELICILVESVPGDDFDTAKLLLTGNYFPQGLARCFQDGEGRTGIILQSALVSKDSLEVTMAELQLDLLRLLPNSIVAVSERMDGVRSIREMYLQTLKVWKCKYHQEKSGVYYFCDLRTSNQAEDIPGESFKRLIESVEANDTDRIESCVREDFAFFAESLLSREVVQTHVANLELMICRRISELNGNPDSIMKRVHDKYGNLGELNDYFRLSSYVSEMCKYTAVYLSELKRQNEGNTIFNVIQYVDREFRNKLQLQDLAKHYHLNSTYMGQLFKKHTGQSFSEYLNEKRIEEAKTLLKRTQLKISDIAVQVGYANTDYFIDKFKALVGVVPSVFRNSSTSK